MWAEPHASLAMRQALSPLASLHWLAGEAKAKKQRPPPTPPFEGLKLGRMLSHSEGAYQGRYHGSDVVVRVRAAARLLLQSAKTAGA